MGRSDIGIESQGIGAVLKHHRLAVPLNQREYSWEEKQVTDLFQDLQKAMNDSQPTYFLGTIALTGQNPRIRDVTDGQQRLATTTILLAAMRDYFYQKTPRDVYNVDSLETTYLTIPDDDEKRRVPRLILNWEDRDYFAKQIATPPDSAERNAPADRPSHKRIYDAVRLARDHVENIVSIFKKDADKELALRRLKDFITDHALVIKLMLPDDMNAFKMFETLNDRGLRTSQVDIVKNYLFQQARDRNVEAQPIWSRMLRELESLEMDDVALTFLRHFLITKTGPTRDREVFEKVEKRASGQQGAIDFLKEVDGNASDYVAVLTPDSRKWNSYPAGIRNSIRTMRLLRVSQIRPLMLAVAREFTSKDTDTAFRAFVNWTVRFLIAGGGRGGTLEEAYATVAKKVGDGNIKTPADLAGELGKLVPTDSEFEAAFSIARVSKNYLARYYLRALELSRQGSKEPEWVPNDDIAINLEHILPENPHSNWPNVDADTANTYSTRLGNLALLQATKNSIIGNAPWADKKKVLAQSAYVWTAEAAQYADWTPVEINDRQKKLATEAVKTWPLKIR